MINMFAIIIFAVFAIILVKTAIVQSIFHYPVTGSATIQVISKWKNISEIRGVLQVGGVLLLKYML